MKGKHFRPVHDADFKQAVRPSTRSRIDRGIGSSLRKGINHVKRFRSEEVYRRVVMVALLTMVFGCGASDQQDTESEDEGRLFGVSFQTMNNPFFVDLNDGLREVIEANGDRLVTLDAQWNSLKQKNDVSDLILQDAAAIFINPVNWEGVKGSLLQAQRKGIPVVIVDAPVKDQDLVLCQVASDNVEAGRLAYMAGRMPRRLYASASSPLDGLASF